MDSNLEVALTLEAMKTIACIMLVAALQLGCEKPERKSEITPQQQGKLEAEKTLAQLRAEAQAKRLQSDVESLKKEIQSKDSDIAFLKEQIKLKDRALRESHAAAARRVSESVEGYNR